MAGQLAAEEGVGGVAGGGGGAEGQRGTRVARETEAGRGRDQLWPGGGGRERGARGDVVPALRVGGGVGAAERPLPDPFDEFGLGARRERAQEEEGAGVLGD